MEGFGSICCTPPPDNYNDLTPEEKHRFGKRVNQLRKQAYDVATAQRMPNAYQAKMLMPRGDVGSWQWSLDNC